MLKKPFTFKILQSTIVEMDNNPLLAVKLSCGGYHLTFLDIDDTQLPLG